jgi:Zn ribbon nucleic-acid-binding protein
MGRSERWAAMGISEKVICSKCGARYTAQTGASDIAQLLHCDKCGHERWITFDQIGDLRTRPISVERYQESVERLVDPCGCGGRFTFDAPARCPSCHAVEHEPDPAGQTVIYD